MATLGTVKRDRYFHRLGASTMSIADTNRRLASLETQVSSNTQRLTTQASMLAVRSIDGTGTNLSIPRAGRATEPLDRQAPSDYDPTQEIALRGAVPPNPRMVSNNLHKGTTLASIDGLSNMMPVWGQFIDHEIVLTPPQHEGTVEMLNMTSPTVADDPEENFPSHTIPFTRSIFEGLGNDREQINNLTSFISGSAVYGSSTERSLALRRLDGTGKLRTSLTTAGEVHMPYNTLGLENEVGPSGGGAETFFVGGDVRANENALLTGMHTVWVREHNRLCDILAETHPNLSEEQIYQHAKRHVSGMIQQITYGEFLPALLGMNALPSSTAYNDGVDSTVKTEFSTVGFRVGHTMLSETFQVGTNPGSTVSLLSIFFNPNYVSTQGSDPLIQGASVTPMQEIDGILVEDVRSNLFGIPAAMMLTDLAALNIQRGRDHGIPDYNTLRVAYGLSAIPDFASLPMDATARTTLENLYGTINDIDPWSAAILETHVPGSQVGPLIHAILVDQFDRLRRGDRFYFENDSALTATEKATIRGTSLADVLRRNTSLNFADDVFRVPS